MAGVEKRHFDSPDESRTPDKTRSDIVHLGGTTAARLTLEPGWSWSQCVKPVAGTDSCQHRHIGVVESGRMRVTHEDGTTMPRFSAAKHSSGTSSRQRLQRNTRVVTRRSGAWGPVLGDTRTLAF